MVIRVEAAPTDRVGRKDLLRERIVPAFLRVLEGRHVSKADLAEDLADAAIDELCRASVRHSTRARIVSESGGRPFCWICGLAIPMDAAEDTAECFSIDHIVPRSAGGSLLGFANLRAAHRLCNAFRDQPGSARLQKQMVAMMIRLRTRQAAERA